MTRQTSFQLTPATEAQLDALKQAGFGTTTDIIRIAIDRMAREEITVITNERIYQSPDDWGSDTVYASEDAMRATIDDLRSMGDGWEEIELADCEEFDFVKRYDGGQMLYEQRGVRQRGYARYFVFAASGNGYYRLLMTPGLPRGMACVAQYDSAEDADEDFA